MYLFRFKQQSIISGQVLLIEPVVCRRKCQLLMISPLQLKNNGKFTWKKLKTTMLRTLLQLKVVDVACKKVFNNGKGDRTTAFASLLNHQLILLCNSGKRDHIFISENIPIKCAAWRKQKWVHNSGKMLKIRC